MRRGAMRKLLRVGAVLMAVSGLLVFLAGCGSSKSSTTASESSGGATASSESSESSESSGSGAKTIKVGIALEGPTNDKSFSQMQYEGVLAAVKDTAGKEAKIELKGLIQNAQTPQDEESAFKTLAASGDEVVILGAAQWIPITDELASQYPNVFFIQTPAFIEHFNKNVLSIEQAQGPAAVVAGAVQEKLTKAKTLGYVGSLKIPTDIDAQYGFTYGAKLVNPNVKVLVDRTGDFEDIAKAKNVATSELDEGAEGLYAFSNAGLIGVYHAAQEAANKPTVSEIAQEFAGCDKQPYPNALGSSLPDMTHVIEDALDKYAEGSLDPGAVLLGLETPRYMNFWLCKKYETPELLAFRKKITEEILSGKVKVPADALQGTTVSYKERGSL